MIISYVEEMNKRKRLMTQPCRSMYVGLCEDYKKLSDRVIPFDMRPSVCDRIIEAIKGFEI